MQELESKLKNGKMSPASQRKLSLQLDKSGNSGGATNLSDKDKNKKKKQGGCCS